MSRYDFDLYTAKSASSAGFLSFRFLIQQQFKTTPRREATHGRAGSERRIKAACTVGIKTLKICVLGRNEEMGLVPLLLFLRRGEGVPKGYLLNLNPRYLLEKATVLWDDVTEELDK